MNGKTIAQIAEEIGVTKQAIQKKMKKEPLRTILEMHMTKNAKTIYINTDGEKLIKAEYGIKTTKKDNQVKNKSTTKKPETIIKKPTTEKPATTIKEPIADNQNIAVSKPKTTENMPINAPNQPKEINKTDNQIKDTSTTEKPATTKKVTTFYDILEVPKNATIEELNDAWEKFMVKFTSREDWISHTKKSFYNMTIKIMDVLTDPVKRHEYNMKVGISYDEQLANNMIIKKNPVTGELRNMIIDMLLILKDSDRTQKLNDYEKNICHEVLNYIMKIHREILK